MKSRSGFRQHICFLSQSPSERVGLSFIIRQASHHTLRRPQSEKQPTPWKVPLEPRRQNGGKGEKGRKLDLQMSLTTNWSVARVFPPGRELNRSVLPITLHHYHQGKKKLINPAVSRFLKSLSQKDICLHTDKLANLMLLPLGCSWLSFWLCQWQNLSPFKCSTRHFARPMQWPRYKRTSDFFCKEKCLRIQNVTHLKHCVINKAHINIKFPQVASVSLFFSSSSAEYEV